MDSSLTMIGSIIIGGLFLLGLVTYQGNVLDFSNEETFELLTQESMAAYIEIIEHDFNRIGRGLQLGELAISVIDTASITFRGDVEGNGTPEIVTYSISNTSAAGSTENPNDVILYRTVNATPSIDSPGGVRRFRLRYYDVTGNQTADPQAVKSIGLTLTVESVHEYNGRYARAVWQKRISPGNLNKGTIYDAGT